MVSVRRYPLSFRGRFYQEYGFNRLVPVWRQAVVPGQTVKLGVQCRVISASFLKQSLAPLIVDLAFFYVPYRLLWDGWVDFIAEGVGNVPKAGTGNPVAHLMFEHVSGTNLSAFGRRAYKLIYNQFFGQEALGEWYSDITDDTNFTIHRVKTVEQYSARVQPGPAAPDTSYTVQGSAIPLNDFYKELMKARAERYENLTGSKYVDAMRRLGVELDWRVQEAPELLQTKQAVVHPSFTAQTAPVEGSNVGRRYSRYVATLEADARQAYRFAEHGLLIGTVVARPPMFATRRAVPDAFAQQADEFYSYGVEKDFDEVEGGHVLSDNMAVAGFPAFTSRNAYLRNGVHMVGNTSQGSGYGEWVQENRPDSVANAIYSDVAWSDHVSDELGGLAAAYYAEGVVSGRTPVPAMPRNIFE